MTSLHRPFRVLLIACMTPIVLLTLGILTRAQGPTADSIVASVADAMCQKQIVLLGELPTHGEAVTFDLKSRIADRLIAQCGFGAVLFEAPIYDFIGLERAIRAQTATAEQLDNAIGRFWLTRELTPWRRRLFETAAAGRVTVGGLDDQVSITSAFARTALPQLVAAACQPTVDRNLRYTYDAAHPFDAAEQEALQRCARSASDTAATDPSVDATDRVMLANFARYADRQRQGVTSSRDESMFRNLAWHLGRLPANTRVIVWTATVHAAKLRGSLADVPMGARASERWGDRVGVVGFTAYGGTTSRAARPAAPIADAPAESLEAMTTRGSSWALLSAEKLRALGRVPSRLLGAFAAGIWSDYFDTVIVIRQEQAPTFDPWK